VLREINWTKKALIAKYQTHLPEKALLTNKLRELRELAEAEGLADDDYPFRCGSSAEIKSAEAKHYSLTPARWGRW